MLLDSLNIAGKGLNASSIAIQVAGQNLTNASTPGYVREHVVLSTSAPKDSHGYGIGTGVEVTGIVQMLDAYLEERLRTSQSDAMNTSTQSGVYSQLEYILNELTDQDLSTELNTFYNSIGNVLNQPESLSIRQMMIDEGVKLSGQIRDIGNSILNARIDINRSIVDLSGQINLITTEIANLNNSIAAIEAGNPAGVEAVGLRDQRLAALSNLSSLVNIKTHEDQNGVVTVYCGGDMLVSTQGAKKVVVDYIDDPYGQISLAEIRFAHNNAPLDVYSGKLNGLYKGRDDILGQFSSDFNEYTATLIKEFNTVYSSGQGLTGYDIVTGAVSVNDTTVPLDKAGLFVTPKSGVFTVLVRNKETDISTSTEINVSFSDTGAEGMSLDDLVASLNTIDGISAKITNNNQLEIKSDSPGLDIGFSGDTSGILSALGVNTFFTGTSAQDIDVSKILQTDPGKLAVSNTGIGADTENGVILAALSDRRYSELDNKSITEAYRLGVTEIMSKAGTVKAIATGDISYYSSLLAQRNSISGVDIDEETLNLMNFQRMYQATAKYVTVINEMLDALIRM